jgi:hypothetical protein
MGNLTKIRKSYFFNTLTSADIGMYTGTAAGAGDILDRMILKKWGVEIPYVSATDTKVVYEQPHYGSKKCIWVNVQNTFIPLKTSKLNDTANQYEYGIDVQYKVKKNGVFGQWFQKKFFYGGTQIVFPSSGLIPDATLEEQEREIIRQIYLHKEEGNKNPGSAVDARRVQKGTYTNTGSNAMGFTVTWYNSSTGAATGATTVFLESSATYTLAHVIGEFNADATVNTKLEMYLGEDATTFYVRSKNAGDLFTLGTAVQCTLGSRWIELRAKSADISFDAKYAEGFATQFIHRELTVDTTGIGATTGKITLRYQISGGSATATDVSQASAAAFVSTINALTGVSATLIGAKAIIFGDRTTNIALDYDLVWNAAKNAVISSGTVIDSPDLMGNTKYPTLTFNEIYAEFASKGNAGMLASMLAITKPTNQDYVKYNFKTLVPTYDGVIPGGQIKEEFAFTIYIPLAILTAAANLWMESNYMSETGDTGFSADKTWIQFLAAWQA